MPEPEIAAHTTLDGHPLDPALGMMHAAAHEVWSDPDRYTEKPRAVAAYAMSLAVEVQGLRDEVARLRSDIRETSGMADDPEGSAARPTFDLERITAREDEGLDMGSAAQRATEVDGHWQIVLDIDQVTSVPLPIGVVDEFASELLDFLARQLKTTGGTTVEWVPDDE